MAGVRANAERRTGFEFSGNEVELALLSSQHCRSAYDSLAEFESVPFDAPHAAGLCLRPAKVGGVKGADNTNNIRDCAKGASRSKQGLEAFFTRRSDWGGHE